MRNLDRRELERSGPLEAGLEEELGVGEDVDVDVEGEEVVGGEAGGDGVGEVERVGALGDLVRLDEGVGSVAAVDDAPETAFGVFAVGGDGARDLKGDAREEGEENGREKALATKGLGMAGRVHFSSEG